MDSTSDGGGQWHSFVVRGNDLSFLPEEQRRVVVDALSRTPIAEVTVKLYSLDPGDARIQYSISEGSILSDMRPRALYSSLVRTVQRELLSAFARHMR